MILFGDRSEVGSSCFLSIRVDERLKLAAALFFLFKDTSRLVLRSWS